MVDSLDCANTKNPSTDAALQDLLQLELDGPSKLLLD
jgi:hypothetical protein